VSHQGRGGEAEEEKGMIEGEPMVSEAKGWHRQESNPPVPLTGGFPLQHRKTCFRGNEEGIQNRTIHEGRLGLCTF